jgi:hypothetical protein
MPCCWPVKQWCPGGPQQITPTWDVCQHQQCSSTAYVELCRLNKGETLLLQYLYSAVHKKRSIWVEIRLVAEKQMGTHELQIGAATQQTQTSLPKWWC